MAFYSYADAASLADSYFVYNGISYLINDDDLTVSVTVPRGQDLNDLVYSGVVSIPETVYNSKTNAWYTVTSIGPSAFYSAKKNNFTNVVIPKTITIIENRAFMRCTDLKSVAFAGNSQLKTIDYYAFNSCQNLTSITIPNSVTLIGNHAFEDSGLKSIKGGEGVVTIDAAAFKGCVGLTEVVIPNSVVTLGEKAFWGCKMMTKVVIGNSVTTVGGDAFLDCERLSNVTIPNSVHVIDYQAFRGCKALQSIVIPNSVTTMGEGVFYLCDALSSVTLSQSLTAIPGKAFETTALKSITIPNSVKTIMPYAFRNCKSLKNIVFGNSLESIGDEVFRGCDGLTKVTIPEPLKEIHSAAFYECVNLTEVTIPGTVTYISNQAFAKNRKLTDFYNLSVVPQDIGDIDVFVNSAPIGDKVRVHVYQGYKAVYEGDFGWTEYCIIIDDIPKVIATSISIVGAPYYCQIGEQKTAIVKFVPENVYTHQLEWSSSDESVLYIDEYRGEFIGLSEGVATITARTTDGSNLTASALVYVTDEAIPVLATGISLNKTSTSLTVGATETLTATVTPSNATNKTVSWKSSNTSVATVDKNGKVTAKAVGTANITATTTDGTNLSATCKVTVTSATVLATGISLNKSSLSLKVGGSETLVATVTPSNTTNKNVAWSSSNTSVATVSSAGKVTAKAVGTANITATTTDGSNLSATCKVTVTPASPQDPCPSALMFSALKESQSSSNIAVELMLVNSSLNLNGFNIEVERASGSESIRFKNFTASNYANVILQRWEGTTWIENEDGDMVEVEITDAVRKQKLSEMCDIKYNEKTRSDGKKVFVILEVLSSNDCRFFPALDAPAAVGRMNLDMSSCADGTYKIVAPATPAGCSFSYTGGPEGTRGWTADAPVEFSLMKVGDNVYAPVLGICTVDVDRNLVTTKYYNLQGIESDIPFPGINIVVMTYSDGTTTSKKILCKQ